MQTVGPSQGECCHFQRPNTLDAFHSVLDTGFCSDVQLICGDKTFNVHKLILCSRSDFFRNAFFKAGMEEQRSGTMTLREKEPAIVKAMLEFLYKRDYTEISDEVSSSEAKNLSDIYQDEEGHDLWSGPVSFNVHVYALATEYFIADLKAFAFSKLKTCSIGSYEDFCKAVLIVHKTIPADETDVYDFMASAGAERIDGIKDSKGCDYLVAHQPRFLVELAVKARAMQPYGKFGAGNPGSGTKSGESTWRCR